MWKRTVYQAHIKNLYLMKGSRKNNYYRTILDHKTTVNMNRATV